MDFDLRNAIENLDQTQVFEIANAARPPEDYLFNSILPSMNMDTYDIDGGSMTIKTTMAGLSGMDSNYTEGGAAEETVFGGKTGKMTVTSYLPERFLRQLQQVLLRATAQAQPTDQLIQETGLNFFNKVIVQSLLDREEWLKGQSLFTGAVDWTFNGKRLQADYGIPDENFLTPRTGNDAYGGTTSKFWVDYYTAQELLDWDIRAVMCHPKTLKEIMANAEVNQLQFVQSDQFRGVFTFARLVNRSGNTVVSSDPRDFTTIITYNKEGEIWDLENPGYTKKVPFCPVGGLLFIGAPRFNNAFVVGQGSTQAPLIDTPLALGYGHVAPSTEGGGRPGRWGRIYVPEKTPWSLAADGVENFLPVIEDPTRIVVATTDIT